MNLFLNLHPYEKEHTKKYLVLYHALRDAIRSGQVAFGDKLPSSRTFAQYHNISRGTATLVYDMLWSDGYIETRHGSGTYVAFQTRPESTPKSTPEKFTLSTWGKRLPTPFHSSANTNLPLSFQGGFPDDGHFPHREWTWSLRRAQDALHHLLLDRPMPPEGLFELRASIASHLNRARGLMIDAEDVLILNGSVQALSLLVHLLINPGDPVVVESPSFLGIRNAVTAAGGRIIPAPVDQDGMVIDKWNSKLAIVTPGHQYPTGCVMQKERRLALLDWAAAHNALILEDDFDSDFRRKGRPIEPLKILDTQGRVAYTGTFSRTLNRSLRVGYLVLPQDLKQPFLQAKQVFESYTTAPLEQMAIAIFMQHGHYERHLRKMARVYARKYERLIQLLDTHLPNAFTWTHSEVGTYLFGWWNHAPKKLDHFEARCKEQGVFWDNLRENFLENPRPAAIFGLAHLDDAKMETAVQIMAACYQSE